MKIEPRTGRFLICDIGAALFIVPENWQGKRFHLEFDGAYQGTEVFVNGRRIGEHRGGYQRNRSTHAPVATTKE